METILSHRPVVMFERGSAGLGYFDRTEGIWDKLLVQAALHLYDFNSRGRIYVASLADYNAGTLHGVWVDCRDDVEAMDGQIHDMLNQSEEPGAEETAIHDFEGFGGWQPSEYESLENVKTVADAIVEHGDAVTHWIDYLGERPDQAVASFGDAYLGSWSTMRDYAENLAEDIGVEVTVDPPSWEPYVKTDFDAVARDLEVELHSSTNQDGSIHVFDPGRIE